MKKGILKWVSFTGSKNLHLVNLNDLNADKYYELLEEFINESESINKRVDARLLYQLNTFPRRGILYSHKYESSNRFNRSGYFNLYRWCTTDHHAARKVSPSATKLWNFLFTALPSGMVSYCDNFLIVDETVWTQWYNHISKNVTVSEKISTTLKSIIRQFK